MKDDNNKLISAEDLFNLKQITQVEIRPNSQEIYYTINQANKDDNGYRQQIWRFDENPQQFSQGLPRDWMIKCSPDGTKLAFLSIRGVMRLEKNKNSKALKPQIFIMPFDGGEAVQLTKLPNGVSNFEWSRDSKKIIFISRLNEEELKEPKEEKKKDFLAEEITLMKIEKQKKEDKKVEPRVITREEYRTGTNYKDDRKGQIHVIDVESKKVNRWTNSTEDDYTFAFLTNDNKYALTARQKPGEGDETRNWEIIHITSKGEITILFDDHYDWGAYFEPSPDGKYLVANFGDKKLGTLAQSKLCLYDLEEKTRTILAEKIDNQKFNFKWSEDNKFIYFLVGDKALTHIWRIEIKTKKIEEVVKGERVIAGYDLSKDGKWIAFHDFNVNDPSRLFKYDLSSKKEKLLHAPNEKFLKKKTLGKTEEVWYDGHNGDFKIQGWILTPPKFDPKKKYPLALNMHGGPHVMWSYHQSIPMFHEFQLLAAEGYVVFYCNPRGSDGYGQDFYKAIEKSWGDNDSQDILIGVDLVVERGYIDTKRMAITGGSYAGFLTSWIIGHDDRFAAAVSQRGVYFLSSFWATSDNARILIDDEFGTIPIEDNQFLWERSPAAYAKNINTPLIILHSDLDYRAPIPDAEMLYMAVKRANPDLDLQFVRYPGEGHELSRSGQPNRRLDRLKRIVDWFNKYCQPEIYKEKQEKKEKIDKIKSEMLKNMRKKVKELK